jgi:methylase of polypeptide subunit release factors
VIANEYVHGYSVRENERLRDQATTLAELLHHDTFYSADSKVLEAGCGIGAQTVILARKCPKAHFTSVDISANSIETARASIEQRGLLKAYPKNREVISAQAN